MSHAKQKPKLIPIWMVIIYRVLRYRDYRKSHLRLIFAKYPNKIGLYARLKLIYLVHKIPYYVETASTHVEQLTFINAIFSISREVLGSVGEVGVFKGGSSCVFSVACQMVGRELTLFDSYEGIPANNEVNEFNLHGQFGKKTVFTEGSYLGSLDEVQNNIRDFGDISVCSFVKGYVEETLPGINTSYICVYCDVDLASATKTVLKYLYPKICGGGFLFSQDCHLSEVISVFEDSLFFEIELGINKPDVVGLHME